MNSVESRFLAVSLMQRYRLIDAGWVVGFTQHKRVCGRCWIEEKRIEISEPIALSNDEPMVREIILHEIAHALTGKRGHDGEWKRKAAAIGCKSIGRVIEARRPSGKWRLWCGNCRTVFWRYRRPRTELSCRACGGTRFDRRYRMDVEMVEVR